MLAEGALVVVKEVAHRLLVPRAIDGEQFFAAARVGDAGDVVGGVFVEHLHLAAGVRVHEDEGRLVAVEVGGGIDQAVVGRELKEGDVVLEVGGEHGDEGFVLAVAIENLRVDAIDDGIDHAQASVMVGGPSLPVAGVFGQQGQFARGQVEAVGVEHLGVAAVQADEHLVGLFLQVVNDGGAHAGEGGIGTQVRAVDVDAEELVVLVAARILDEEDAGGRGPEVARHAAQCLAGEAHGLGITAEGLDKDVHAVVPRRHVRQVAAVGGNLVGRLGRVAEEVFYRNGSHKSLLR